MILEELLRFREAPSKDTADFNWKHQKLCDVTSEKLETIASSFLKYHHINYVIQGPRDQGVDVLLKSSSDDGTQTYVGLQLKSYAELEDRKNDLSKNLKAGLHDAKMHYGPELERYYIALCGDATKHSMRISAITNEFAKDPIARVIGPRHLLTFMTMPDSTVYAVVDRMLRKGDFVRIQAKKEMQEYDDAEIYFLLSCLVHAFENGSDQISEKFLLELQRSEFTSDRFGEERFIEVHDKFHDSMFEHFKGEENNRIRTESFPATRALYFDLEVRYESDAKERFSQLYEFLRA